MSSSKGVPDAWDDDWVNNQTSTKAASDEAAPPKKLSKAERRRQQYEFNKKMWEDAEAPEQPYFVQKSNEVPLQSGFTPAMKLLSRRPAPVTLAKKDPITGLEKLSIQVDDGDDDDEEEQERKALQRSLEERTEKAKREREEKQRKYDEVRQRLFGATNSGTGQTPNTNGRGGGGSQQSLQHMDRSGRGRGRGGSQGSARANPGRQLFDPSAPSRGGSASSSGTNTPVGEMPIRAPRGPDGSGKDGRGFLNRGGGAVGS